MIENMSYLCFEFRIYLDYKTLQAYYYELNKQPTFCGSCNTLCLSYGRVSKHHHNHQKPQYLDDRR